MRVTFQQRVNKYLGERELTHSVKSELSSSTIKKAILSIVVITALFYPILNAMDYETFPMLKFHSLLFVFYLTMSFMWSFLIGWRISYNTSQVNLNSSEKTLFTPKKKFSELWIKILLPFILLPFFIIPNIFHIVIVAVLIGGFMFGHCSNASDNPDRWLFS